VMHETSFLKKFGDCLSQNCEKSITNEEQKSQFATFVIDKVALFMSLPTSMKTISSLLLSERYFVSLQLLLKRDAEKNFLL
jgi:hypothetical protein